MYYVLSLINARNDSRRVFVVHVICDCCRARVHSMSTCTCGTQMTCLRKVCGHVTVSDHQLSKPGGFNVSFYVYMW